MLRRLLLLLIIIIVSIFSVIKFNKNLEKQKNNINIKLKAKEEPKTPEIGDYVFGYQSYEDIYSIFKKWESEAEDLVEVGSYGKTNNQKDQYYLKISNEYNPSKKNVFITACIHGNEPLSTSVVIAYAGMILSGYGKEESITSLLNKTNVYIIPVVSPDSYPNSRSVNGIDPNRNFPTLKDPKRNSVPPIKNLQDFFLKIKPNSVLAGHTYGRIYLIPWGDSNSDNPNLSDYEKIAREMCNLSGYRYQRACEMYNKPIFGTEIDWYHRNGAFAMVMEFGSHQRKPTVQETKKEFEKTYKAILFFIQESIGVDIKQNI